MTTYNYVTLTGTLYAGGQLVTGSVMFSPSEPVESLPPGIAPEGFMQELVNGTFSIPLMATDSLNFFWTISVETEGTPFPSNTFYLSYSNGANQSYNSLGPAGLPITPLLATNNLSDISDPAAALNNLGGATSAALTAEVSRAEEAEGALIPASQSFSLPVNDTWQSVYAWTVTGQTDDPLPATGIPTFELLTTSRTYGVSTPIQGPVLYFGYNPRTGIGAASNNAHGSATMNIFADAGDTNNGAGGHGIEINLSFRTPNNSLDTGAFQMVAVDDNTNTLTTTIRCGSGSSDGGSITSEILFQNGNASTTFCVMSNANSNITFFEPVVFESPLTFIDSGGITWPLVISDPTTDSSVTFGSANTGTTASLTINGTSTSTSSEIFFSTSGVQKWTIEHTPPYLYIRDIANSRSAVYFEPGATAAAALVQINSCVQALSSLIVGSAAIATTATDGFLYLPSCAGPPTGTPTTKTGTIPCVFDSTDGKLYFYTGGAWVGLVD